MVSFKRVSVALLGGLLAVAAAGCGGDPIVGNWRSQMSGTEITMQFKGDLSLDYTVVANYDTTATMRASCRETVTVTQGTYSVMGGNIQISGQGVCRLRRENCANPADNAADAPCPVTIPVLNTTQGAFVLGPSTGTSMVSSTRLTLNLTPAAGMGTARMIVATMM